MVFGGFSDLGYYNDLWLFVPSPPHWLAPASSGTRPSARKGHAMVYLNDRVYVWGCSAAASEVRPALFRQSARSMSDLAG